MKTPTRRDISRIAAVVTIGVVCLRSNAQAQPIPNPLEPNESDLFRITYTTPAGVPKVYELLVPEGDPKDTAIVVPLVDGKPIEGDPAMFGSPLVLVEPTVPGNQNRLISDVLGVIKDNTSGNGYSIAFTSDADPSGKIIDPIFLDPNNPNAQPDFVPEDPEGVGFSQYIYNGGGLGTVVTARFFSDVEVPDGGSTVVLLACGCLGVLAFRGKICLPRSSC